MNELVLDSGKVLAPEIVDQFCYNVEIWEKINGEKPPFFHYSPHNSEYVHSLNQEEVNDLLRKVGRQDLI